MAEKRGGIWPAVGEAIKKVSNKPVYNIIKQVFEELEKRAMEIGTIRTYVLNYVSNIRISNLRS